MPTFSEGSAGSLAMHLVDLEGKNTVSEESRTGVEKARSESVGRESDSWWLSSV